MMDSIFKLRKRAFNEFQRYLFDLIAMRGPISVAGFMKEALYNPKFGYYSKHCGSSIVGKSGDFTTSPEISQMFGELVGIWCISVWKQLKEPKTIGIVELGPGKGTLMSDLIRIARRFPSFESALNIHLVEKSPSLKEIQRAKLMQRTHVPLCWHEKFSDISKDAPLIVIAQEFFDCLPVHQFEFTERGWLEKMVDINQNEEKPGLFQFVLSPGPTLATKILLNEPPGRKPKLGEKVEICTEGIALVKEIGSRFSKPNSISCQRNGGAALIIDYGENFPLENSLKAIRGHEFVDIFHTVGETDLSCLVDFSSIKRALESEIGVHTYGPITQQDFLKAMGIEMRLSMLLKNASSLQAEELISGYKRLTEKQQMGTSYKVISISSDEVGIPAGFS